jgi:hypothetical protein
MESSLSVNSAIAAAILPLPYADGSIGEEEE